MLLAEHTKRTSNLISLCTSCLTSNRLTNTKNPSSENPKLCKVDFPSLCSVHTYHFKKLYIFATVTRHNIVFIARTAWFPHIGNLIAHSFCNSVHPVYPDIIFYFIFYLLISTSIRKKNHLSIHPPFVRRIPNFLYLNSTFISIGYFCRPSV